jgi:hypothetical protein
MLRTVMLGAVSLILVACGTASSTAPPTAAPTSTTTVTAPPASVAPPSLPATTTPTGLSTADACGTDWVTSAGECGGEVGDQFLFQCPPGGREVPIWGTDTYTSDSGVCTAAVHAGRIDFAAGGSVVIEIRPGQDTYLGTARNGVTSYEYGTWGSSFAFVDASATGSNADYEGLLTHIPASIRDACSEVDPTAAAALAVANCNPDDLLGSPDAVVDDVVYVWYATLNEATARYAQELSEVGDQAGDDCRVGPSQVAYEVDGTIHGRLLCAPDAVFGDESIAWWYDDRLNVVGSVLLAQGSYEDLFNAVVAATAQP